MIKRKYFQHKETINNLFWRALQLLGKQGIILLIFFISAKILSTEDFGIYNYVLSIAFFLVIIGDFGISTSTSKYVAEYSVTNIKKMRAVLFNSAILILVLGILISIIVIFFGRNFLGENYDYVLYLLPIIILSPLTSLYDGVYRGLKKFKKLSLISISVGGTFIIIVYFMVVNFGLIGAIIAQSLFYFSLLIGLFLGHQELYFKINKEVMKEVGKYSLLFGLASFGYYLFSRTDLIILGKFGFMEELATYELINKIFMVLLMPFAILGQVLAPNFSRFFAEKKYKLIYKKLKKYTLIFFILGIIFAASSYFVVPLIIKLFFIKYFTSYFMEIFLISTIIFMINIWASSVDSGIVVPTGYARLMTYFYLPLGIINIGLSIFFLKLFGFMGVLYATVFSSVAMVFGLRLLYFKKIKEIS
jgi:O-antigen/teichoic acid export membrane protein